MDSQIGKRMRPDASKRIRRYGDLAGFCVDPELEAVFSAVRRYGYGVALEQFVDLGSSFRNRESDHIFEKRI
jgi:hypothetical protein